MNRNYKNIICYEVFYFSDILFDEWTENASSFSNNTLSIGNELKMFINISLNFFFVYT